MKVAVIGIGKVKNSAILTLGAEYLKRSREIKVVELNLPGAQALSRVPQEGKALLKAAERYDVLICLDEGGKQLDSRKFADLLASWQVKGKGSVAFLLGGAFGHSEDVRRRCDLIWALSDLTFPFQFARLLVIEQVYRALCMLRGHPYHKD